MAPILPGLSDRPELMADVIRAARDAGATGVWANVLYLEPGTREHFLEHLARDWPELLPTYERLYARGAYAAKPVVGAVKARVSGLAGRTASPTAGGSGVEPADRTCRIGGISCPPRAS